MGKEKILARAIEIKKKKKIGGNRAFFRDNKAPIWRKMPYIVIYFSAFRPSVP